MESLIFFVIVMGINLITKSVNDKKKIEIARKKRVEQLKNNPLTDELSQQMDQWNMEAEKKQKNVEQYHIELYEDTKKKESEDSYQSISYVERLEYEEAKLKESDLDISIKNKKKMGQKELVNAVIWSQILGEAKSVQNMKRGM